MFDKSRILNYYFIAIIFLAVTATSCGSAKKARIRKADTVVNTARNYIGTPYKWGGTTRAGMDCSGLLITSYSSIKVDLPRTTSEQKKVGKKTSLDKAKKGDLVFFAMSKKKRKITHVGLVTDVRKKDDVRFIHASSSLGVVETNVYSEYYLKRLRMVRRVID